MIPAGRFITLEGGEGAGKSTHIQAIKQQLEARGITVLLTREPGGTKGAEAIRNLVVNGVGDRWDPLTELFLMMAARQDHVTRCVAPALAAGNWVISDRFHDSSRVYQGLAGGLGLALVDQFHAPILATAKPDLTILIDLDPQIGLQRRAGQAAGTRFEAKGLAFHEKVRDGFLTLAQMEPSRFLVVDGAQELASVEAEILAGVEQRLL